MLYMSICKTRKNLPRMAASEQIQEWVRVCRDDQLHGKCKVIKCFEPVNDEPHRLMLLIDTDDAGALKRISNDFGRDWEMETYALHPLYEVPEEDHSIVAG